jgi:methyl-accepting chemotaxis protein
MPTADPPHAARGPLRSSREVSAHVFEVAEAAAETTDTAANTAVAAVEIARGAHEFQQSVAMFRY